MAMGQGPRDGPGLSYGQIIVGTVGLSLLRLHADDKGQDQAAASLSELTGVLANLESPAYRAERRGPSLDVVSGYGRWATVYDDPGNPLISVDKATIAPLLDELPVGLICDAACGTGRYLEYLAARGHTVVGVDLSPAMLDQARTKVPSADLRVGDLKQLPFPDRSMDAVVCGLALEHMDELGKAYREFARVVRPGGSIIVSTIHPMMRLGLGWWAWFRDQEGRGDIRTFEHQVSDHVNAAIDAGLQIRACLEPRVSKDLAVSLAPAEAPFAGMTAMEGLPILLALVLDRPADVRA